MADMMVFGVKFDLQKGVEEALKDGDKALERIEKALGKHPITIKLRMDNKVARGASTELTGFRKQLAELTQQWNTLTAAERGSAAGAAIREKFRALRTEAQGYTSTLQAAVKAEDKMRESQAKTASTSNKLSSAYHNQTTYLSRLIQRMAAYAGVSYVSGFLTHVREVTAEFELQRISLGAIIQDQARANQLFEEIKTFALKSPVKILDLTKYTKQLAAYKIGVDELFDTTKRLTDISVGLGVSMDRIVLMYGQIRATGYLRASEVRQATEAGIPLVEELAAKLTKANGELVTAADVMDMISKRAISFDMVKDVFTDMTSAGGTFYNMQEKQGNTLYGLWAKLGDAASVMYEQIGNTGVVNEGMKEAIQMLTELMRNWKAVGLTAATSILPAVAAMAAWKMATKALAKSVATATNERIVAEAKLATAMKGTDVAAQNAARSSLAKAKADEAAAIAAQKNATAQSKLKMGFVSLGKTIASGLGIGIAVMLVTNLIYKFYEAITNFRKLEKELGSIYTETATLQDQSVRNFEFLADKAVKAANGSKEQTDALQELSRTYRDILPQEALTIENLTKMKGNYDALTQSIREYIAEQQRQKAESSIFEYYGTKIRDAQNDVRERLFDQGLSATEVGRFFAEFEKVAPKYGEDVWGAFRESMLAAGIKDKKRIAQIWKKEFEFTQRDIVSSDTGNANIRALSDAYADQANELKGMNEQYREAIGQLGKFSDMQKRVSDTVANATYKDTSGKPIDADKQGDLLSAMKFNLWVKKTASEIQNNEDIQKAFEYMGEGIKSEWFNIINALDANNLGNVSQINFDAIIASVDNMIEKLGNKNPEILTILNTFRNYLVAQKKEYENMAPSETVIVRWRNRWRAIVSELKISGQNMNRFLMQSSEDFEAYRKRIKEEVTAVINQINILNEAIKARISARAAGDDNYTKEQEAADKKKLKQAEERKKALQKLLADLDKIEIDTGKNKKGGGTKSDNRLSILKELFSEYKAMYDEYKKLSDTLGADKAADKMEEVYGEVAKQFKKYGLEIPMSAKKAADGMQVLIGAMEKLRGAKSKKGQPLFATLEKDISSAKATLANFNAEEFRKEIEKKLKALADRISRTKTAREFYEKILSQTGDVELATRVSLSIYGSTGEELFEDTVAQIREVFKSGKKDVVIDLEPVFDMTNQRIDYKMLADIYEKYQNDIIEKNRDTAKKIAQEGQKEVASNITNWQKELAKAQSYEEQRTAIIQRESEKRAKIIKEVRDPKVRNRFVSLSYDKQAQDLAKLAVDEFKSSDDYIKVFQDLDRVSTQTLDRMKKRLQKMIATVKDTENVDGLKSLVEQLDKINAERETRNPIEGLVNSFKKYAQARKAARTAEAEEAKVKAEFAQQELGLNMAIQRAKIEQTMAQQRVTDLEAQGKQHTNEYVTAQLALKNAKDKVTQADERRRKAVKRVEDAEQGTTDAADEMKDAMHDMQKSGQAIVDKFKAAASAIQTIADMMGVAEDSELGDIVNGLVSGLNNAATIMSTILTLAVAIQSACWWLLAIGAAVAAFTAIGSWLTGSKVRKANKEIERQQELLDQLEYAYGRLEKAADKAFGADYLNNYNQQLKVLQAQQAAYLKQAEAERSKGKDEDEAKTQEYLNNARDIADKIADMQNDLAAQFLGGDIASVARDFASAWLDAYKEFGNTTDAMSKKFKEMIQQMVANSVIAQVMKRALEPTFKLINEMQAQDFYSESFWSKVVAEAERGAEAGAHGAEVIAKMLEKSGIDLRDIGSEYTGIAKDIAGATSEEINTAAAIGNTIMYHTSHLPIISQNVAAMYQLMLQGKTTLPDSGSTGWTDWQQQAMAAYNATAKNTADMVVRCERAAVACEAMAEKMGRAFRAKGTTSGFNVWLNS